MYRRDDTRRAPTVGQGMRVPPREPSYYQQRLRVPSNYSGNAFRSEEMAEPAIVEDTRPHFEDLPRVSNLPVAVPNEPSVDLPTEASPDEAPPESVLPESVATSSGMRSLLDGAHFPFGHGLGYEELFLLGLMALLLLEGDGAGDTYETLLLLGALLLCG